MSHQHTTRIVLTNARLHTMDDERPHAEAMAIGDDGRIVAVGDLAEVTAYSGPDVATVDLEGATVIPGLIDVHNHHAMAGLKALVQISFADTATLPEILDALRAWIAEHPDDEWVTGGSWGSPLIDELNTPEALVALDEASAGKLVVLADDSLHNRWANSAAMAAAGIDADSADPEGGRIMRDADGRPTGVLLEAAGTQVTRVHTAANPLSPETMARCSAIALEIMHRVGVTAFLDAGATSEIMAGLKLLDEQGGLTAWAGSSMLINDQIFGADPIGDDLFVQREEMRSPRHRPDFAKIFLDGVPPAYTGAFLEPYRPSPEHGDHFCGHTTMPAEELQRWLMHCAEIGLNVKIHCTGDASVRHVLDAVEAVRAAGHGDTIFHIAHGQFVDPADVPRFAPLGVYADISPALWFPGVIVEAIKAVRPEPGGTRIQPNRDLLAAGAVVTGGSDWPVAPDPNPWIGICGLVTRQDPSGTFPGTLWPEQALTLDEAVAAYTISSARAIGIGELTGSLAPGKSADFVVLDRDPWQLDPVDLVSVEAQETWFAGECVYRQG